jgi:enoyl-CoA hydratase/carnithine racemase
MGAALQKIPRSQNTLFPSTNLLFIERERQGLSSCAAHPDGQEGLKAFSEKRKPKFNLK